LKRLFSITLILLLFALYMVLFCCVPFVILGNPWGILLGFFGSVMLLFTLFYQADRKIFLQLSLEPLSRAEAPEIYHVLEKGCRRLNITEPSIARLKSEALNIGVFGLTQGRTFLIVTDGLLNKVNRSQLTALVGRELTSIYYGDSLLSSWLARFLGLLEKASLPSKTMSSKHRSFYSIRWVVTRMVFVPIAIIPETLLLKIRRKINLDMESIKLTRLPSELAESYRLIEASSARACLKAPVSLSPLFLASLHQSDPISKLIISHSSHSRLLDSIKELRQYS